MRHYAQGKLELLYQGTAHMAKRKPKALCFFHDIQNKTIVELVCIPGVPFPSKQVDDSQQASLRCA